MTEIYLVTMSPKREYRGAYYHHYVLLVSAKSAKDAVTMIPSAWPLGDGAYKKPLAFKTGNGFQTLL